MQQRKVKTRPAMQRLRLREDLRSQRILAHTFSKLRCGSPIETRAAMIPVLVALVVAQSGDFTPPPLVESAIAPPKTAPVAVEVKDEPHRGNYGVRIGATFAGALLGLAPALALMAASSQCGRYEGCFYVATFGGTALAPLTTGLGAFLAHRLAGGHGTFGRAVAGAAIGLGVASVGSGIIFAAIRSDSTPTKLGILGVAAVTALAITAGMLEYSHGNESSAIGVAFAPTTGGATVSVGGRF